MSKQKELVKNTAIVAIGRLSTQFLSFLLLPLFTIYLSANDYGTVDIIITYISLIYPIATLALDMAVFRQLIDNRYDNKQSAALVSTAFFAISTFSLLSIAFFIVIALFYSIPFGVLPLATCISIIYSNLLMQTSRGLGDNKNYAIASMVTGFSSTILNVLFIIVIGMKGESILISTMIGNLLAVIYLLFIKGNIHLIKPALFEINILKNMLSYSIPLVPNGASIWVLNAASRTIVAFFINVTAAGILAVSYKFPTILTALGGIFGMTWTESAAKYIKSPRKERDNFFSSVINHSLILFMSITLVIISSISIVFSILVDRSFQEAYLYIPLLLIAALLTFINQNYGAIYLALKKSIEVLKTTVVAAVVSIVSALILVPMIGLWGGSLSGLLGYLFVVVYRYFDLYRYVTIQYDWARILGLLPCYVIVFSLYYINYSFLNVLNLVFTIVVFVVANKKITKKVYIKLRYLSKTIHGMIKSS